MKAVDDDLVAQLQGQAHFVRFSYLGITHWLFFFGRDVGTDDDDDIDELFDPIR